MAAALRSLNGGGGRCWWRGAPRRRRRSGMGERRQGRAAGRARCERGASSHVLLPALLPLSVSLPRPFIPCRRRRSVLAAWSSTAAAALGRGSEEAGPCAELGRDPTPAMSASTGGRAATLPRHGPRTRAGFPEELAGGSQEWCWPGITLHMSSVVVAPVMSVYSARPQPVRSNAHREKEREIKKKR